MFIYVRCNVVGAVLFGILERPGHGVAVYRTDKQTSDSGTG